MGTSSSWTPERRAKQAEAIRRWRPWSMSTGPRTTEGKACSSRNADKGIAERDALILGVRLRVRETFEAKAVETLRLIDMLAGNEERDKEPVDGVTHWRYASTCSNSIKL